MKSIDEPSSFAGLIINKDVNFNKVDSEKPILCTNTLNFQRPCNYSDHVRHAVRIYIDLFMGGIKLENGVSGEICGTGPDALIRIRVPEGASVLCTKDTVVFSDPTMDQVVHTHDECGQPVWALTSTKGESEAYLAPQYGDATVALKASCACGEHPPTFILYDPRSLVAMSDMCASSVEDTMPVEGGAGAHTFGGCLSVSGKGVALVAGHGSVVVVELKTSEKSLVCERSHLLAVLSVTKRESVVYDDEQGRPSKIKLTGPGAAYLQSKVKP